MTVLNDVDLIKEIETDRDWRLKELNFFKNIPQIYSNSLFKKHEDAFWKFCIPIIYSHWEGFVISSLKLLVDYMNSQKLYYPQITEKIIILSNKKRFEKILDQGRSCNADEKIKFVNNLLMEDKTGLNIEHNCINANSNLNFERLKKMMNEFNIEMTQKLEKNEKEINEFVKNRNKIAHGENSYIVDKNHVRDRLDCIEESMDELIIIIKDFVQNKKYLR